MIERATLRHDCQTAGMAPRTVRAVLKPLAVVVAMAALVLGACSSPDSGSGSGNTSPSAGSPSASSPQQAPFPVASDGSIITPSGFVFKSDFAICNKAKCVDKDGKVVACECARMTDQWTLSPVPKASLETLTTDSKLMSTFTTANIGKSKAFPCSGGKWADCYGALCTEDSDGTVTCECPYAKQNAGDWVKYVDNCDGASCGGDLVSAAPVFPEGSAGMQDYLAAVTQSGDPEPATTKPCSDSTKGSTTGAEGDCPRGELA